MATLRELEAGGRSEKIGITTPPSASIAPVQTQSTKQVDLMLQDVQKLTTGATQITKAVMDTSEYADKVRANDTYGNFVNGMNEIDKHYQDKLDNGEALTVQDYKDKKDWQSSFLVDMTANGIQEGDETNLIFREKFLKPANQIVAKTNGNDTSKQFAVHRTNVIDEVNKDIDTIGSSLNNDVVQANIERLKLVGVAGAEQKVWGQTANSMNSEFTDKFKDGVDSTNLIPYLSNGYLTDAGIDKLFNDTYSNFAVRTDGTYNKVNQTTTDEAYESMKKSFNGWVDNYNRELNKKSKKLNLTVSETASKTNVATSTLAQATTALNTSIAQTSDAIKRDPRNDYSTEVDMLSGIATKVEKIGTIETAYSNIMNGDKTYSEVMGEVHEITTEERIVADGVTVTISGEVISNAEIKNRIDNNLERDITRTINGGNAQASSTLGVNVGLMNSDGYTGGKALKLIDDSVKNFNNNGFRAASSTNQLMSSLHMNASFLKTNGQNNASFINDGTIRQFETYRTSLEQRAETDNSLTPDVILAKMKDLTYSMSADWKAANEGSRKAKFLSNADIVEDDLVSGVVFGDTQLANGVFDGLLGMAENEARPLRTKQDMIDYAKAKTMEVDPSHFPIFGTSISFINPLKSNSSSAQTMVRKNLQTLITKDISNFSGKEIDVSDLSDEDDTRLFQFVSQNGEIHTVINMYRGSDLLFTSIYTPNELQTGEREFTIPKGLR